MTSEERKEGRYQRRKAKRKARKQAVLKEHGCYYDIIDRNALAKAAEAAASGVRYKASVKRYLLHRLVYVARANKKLLRREDVRMGFICFTLVERGKPRHIMSQHFAERVIQKSYNVNALIPAVSRSLIYDNGASQKNKGTSFAIRRMTELLMRHYRHYGTDGYVLVLDIENFFGSMVHEDAKSVIRNAFDDSDTIRLGCQFIDAYYEFAVRQAVKHGRNPDDIKPVGLGLGSEINQTIAISITNDVDHYIKDVLRIKCYQRTMDDSILVHPSKEYLEYCLERITELYAAHGLRVNTKKTHIVKLTHGFTYLKTQFFVTETGKIIKKPCREAVTRTRRVMKKHRRMVDEGIMTFEQAADSYASRRSNIASKTARRTIYTLDNLFESLFINEINENERRWAWWQALRKGRSTRKRSKARSTPISSS